MQARIAMSACSERDIEAQRFDEVKGSLQMCGGPRSSSST